MLWCEWTLRRTVIRSHRQFQSTFSTRFVNKQHLYVYTVVQVFQLDCSFRNWNLKSSAVNKSAMITSVHLLETLFKAAFLILSGATLICSRPPDASFYHYVTCSTIFYYWSIFRRLSRTKPPSLLLIIELPKNIPITSRFVSIVWKRTRMASVRSRDSLNIIFSL